MTISNTFQAYQDGILTKSEVFGRLLDKLTPDNIAAIVNEIPEDFKQEFQQNLSELISVKPEDIFYFSACIYTWEITKDQQAKEAFQRQEKEKLDFFRYSVIPAIKTFLTTVSTSGEINHEQSRSVGS